MSMNNIALLGDENLENGDAGTRIPPSQPAKTCVRKRFAQRKGKAL